MKGILKALRYFWRNIRKKHWLMVTSPRPYNEGQSRRFQEELAQWLEERKEAYEKELEKL